MGFQIHVAATKNDWIELFKQAQGEDALRFYTAHAADRESIVPIRLDDLPDFGMARTGIAVHEAYYLAIPTTEEVVPEKIHQNDGVIRYSLNELANYDACTFWPGGSWKDDFYVIGEMSSIHKEGITADLVKKMRRIMRKTFTFGGIYWIGPECKRLYGHCTFTFDFRYPTAWK